MNDRLCCICKIPLTENNCSLSRFTHGGPCRPCRNSRNRDKYAKHREIYRKKNAERIKKWREGSRERYLESARRYKKEHSEECSKKEMKYNRTLKGRFNTLKKRLRKEGTPSTDLIWNFNFYSELIKDALCCYCLGPLELAGHGLDRIDNSLGHVCFNVIPCCRSCNRKKWDDTSYEEMMLLVPALREIRRRREAPKEKKNGDNSNHDSIPLE